MGGRILAYTAQAPWRSSGLGLPVHRLIPKARRKREEKPNNRSHRANASPSVQGANRATARQPLRAIDGPPARAPRAGARRRSTPWCVRSTARARRCSSTMPGARRRWWTLTPERCARCRYSSRCSGRRTTPSPRPRGRRPRVTRPSVSRQAPRRYPSVRLAQHRDSWLSQPVEVATKRPRGGFFSAPHEQHGRSP